MILDTGFYHCDFTKSDMQTWKLQYDWLACQMVKRIGDPPEGVAYPVWAWHTWEKGRRKPDLRNERWTANRDGERWVRMEIEIPDSQVLCSDFDAWLMILLDGFLSSSEQEDDRLEKIYSSLSLSEQKQMKEKNWEGVFDLTLKSNVWMTRGECIQATFWELKKEQIRKVTRYTKRLSKKGAFYMKKEPALIS